MPLQFYLYPVPNKQNENAIRVSINVKGARLITTIGYSVKPDAWLEGAQVKLRYTNSKGVPARVINDRISKIKLHFNEYELQQKTRPTLKELREELDIAFALGNDLLQDETVEAPKEKKKTIYQYLLKEKFFESLPISFNRAAYLPKARELNIPERTADKQIKSFCVKGMLVNVQHGKYEKG